MKILQMLFRRCVYGGGGNRNKDSEIWLQKVWQDKTEIMTKAENLNKSLSCVKV